MTDSLPKNIFTITQGEDVVSGRCTVHGTLQLSQVVPKVYTKILRVKDILEEEFRDLQDFEFTVQDGKLYMLQTRPAKRTPWAALKVALDMYHHEMIDADTVLQRLVGFDLESLEQTTFDTDQDVESIATATPASIGVTTGAIAFSPDKAVAMAESGQSVILVRKDTVTADIAGIASASGVLTAAGCRTSHAAVVARQLGKVCLVDCPRLHIEPKKNRCTIAGHIFVEGDFVSLDGNNGAIYIGQLPIKHEKPTQAIAQIRQLQNKGRSGSKP